MALFRLLDELSDRFGLEPDAALGAQGQDHHGLGVAARAPG